jgi:hypothetical protein
MRYLRYRKDKQKIKATSLANAKKKFIMLVEMIETKESKEAKEAKVETVKRKLK